MGKRPKKHLRVIGEGGKHRPLCQSEVQPGHAHRLVDGESHVNCLYCLRMIARGSVPPRRDGPVVETPNERHDRVAPDLLITLAQEEKDPSRGMVIVESFLFGVLEYYFPNADAHGKQVALETLTDGVIKRILDKEQT